MQIPHLQILGKTEDWSYTRKISHKSCDSVIIRSRVTAPLKKKNSRHVIYSAKITAFNVILTYIVCTQNISSPCTRLIFHWLVLRTCSKLLSHTHFWAWIGGRGKILTCHRCGPGMNTGVPGVESWCRYVAG